MQIQSTITVSQTRDVVWNFLADPHNSSKWDRSIASVVVHESSELGVGTEVETTAPPGMCQRFRINEFRAPEWLRFTLLQSSIFKTAELAFRLESIPEGTVITHEIRFTHRWYAIPLYIVLLLNHKQALRTDLEYLRRALEAI